MTIQELLKQAFNAGRKYQEKLLNSTEITDLIHFEEWLEENEENIRLAKVEHYQEGYNDGYYDHKNLD